MIVKLNRKSGALLAVFLLLMTSTSIQINALSDDFKVDVHAKVVEANDDSLRNDIAISGNIIISGMEGIINVDLQIDVVRPDGTRKTQHLILEGKAWKNRNTLLTYETTVMDFATMKGMYYVTVTASSADLTASASFKFDPPGGGGGPPEY